MAQAVAPLPPIGGNSARASSKTDEEKRGLSGVRDLGMGEAGLLDLDGDGIITDAELVHAARKQRQLQLTGKKLRVSLGIVSAVSVAVIGILLGLVLVANEISKDARPAPSASGQSTMLDNSGNIIATAVAREYQNLTSLASAPSVVLDRVQKLSILNGTSLLSYKVSGYEMKLDESAVTFFTLRGHAVRITPTAAAIFGEDGKELPLLANSASGGNRRHLLQTDGDGNGIDLIDDNSFGDGDVFGVF
uniref:EF-hand domain-containing protein n=2 Tax=Palpitomonas bilix TaxID=652834 RepID=A0A7S3DCB1_9EUKA|mmetsp:Transcript_3060/g.5918  ORF Transcript_3060/g.5918 Transcript_3060/m.5918 type:complete len:248 (+) Transcript_3060:201-944(+)|eukprot:CAMPEP_0113886532 /NCGR_PEP_ID=MMETSP0780_2-20120614/11614_1 /TAXON_ID=652834 /ORGANISM="Palpitomonas bilix" /LENGTH=247 /DNA_ID=CAMNT_0000874771 /DNA_START=196 /DNA_END=939 /DNA_ORIENTATION=- /assembly_acc=CAM_ASM_000599